MSLEERLLLCLPPRSRRRTSFGRHRRSVQAWVSLNDVTPDRAARRQRTQASSAAFGMCVLSGAQDERTSAGVACRRRSVIRETGLSRDGCYLGQSGPGGDETGADRTNMEGTVGHPQVEDQAFQEPRGVHLNVGLETLFRGLVLSLFFMRRWAAKLSKEGQRQTRFARRGRGPTVQDPFCDGQSVPPRHLGAALRCRVSRTAQVARSTKALWRTSVRGRWPKLLRPSVIMESLEWSTTSASKDVRQFPASASRAAHTRPR